MQTQRFKPAGFVLMISLQILALTAWAPLLTAQVEAVSPPKQQASLPVQAQTPVSAFIGADQAAYHASLAGTHFHMDNPAHGLAVEFTKHGMQLSTGSHLWGLALDGYGYGESLQMLTAVTPASYDNRIEYIRGPIIEWYINGPFGLEQGFTLASPPAGMTGGPLTLALSQSGDLQASVGTDGKELVLSANDGETVLIYTGLAAYDADKRELHSWLENHPGVNGHTPFLLLRLDDHGARYPLTIDPFIQKVKLTSPDKAQCEEFGFSVAASGNVVVVGARGATLEGKLRAGAAYVFVKPNGGWGNMGHYAKLTASNRRSGDAFGVSVAIDGDVVVVGADDADPLFIANAGAAYVFVKPVGGWTNMTESAKLTSSHKANEDYFGSSVAVSGDVVVVGAEGANPGGVSDAGAAYVFVKPTDGWKDMTQTAILTASDKAEHDYFGSSAAIDGNLVVIGAHQRFRDRPGAAYVFVKPGSGWTNMTQTAKLTASGQPRYDDFGYSVAVRGDVIVAGAPATHSGEKYETGVVYLFIKPSGGWTDMTETARLTALRKGNNYHLGSSVAIGSKVIVAGATGATLGGRQNAGAAYVFFKPSGGWTDMTETGYLTASDMAEHNYFGQSVAISGDNIFAGAPYNNPGGTIHAGAAYVFVFGSITTIISDIPDPSLTGQSVNVRVTVIGDTTTPTGKVSIRGAEHNCSILLFEGMGICNVIFDTPGPKILTASYSGDGIYPGSSDSEEHQVNPLNQRFRSVGAYDGWIRESSENSGIGHTTNVTAARFYVGDDAADKQYLSILSFDTTNVPDNAIITSVTMKIRRQSLVGNNPFNTHQGLLVDICKPYFGTSLALLASDFQAPSGNSATSTFNSTTDSGWYIASLDPSALKYISKTGTTQFRLRFKLDDNDDLNDDYVLFYSGNYSTISARPLLIILYYIPELR